MRNIDVKIKIPKSIQNDFWNDFLDAISDELNLLKTEVEKKKYIYDLRNLTDYTTINEIGDLLGRRVNITLNGDIDYLKENTNILYDKIQQKTSYYGYQFILNAMPLYTDITKGMLGDVYNLYYDGTKLIKAINSTDTITNLDSWVAGEVFLGIIPEYNFSLYENTITTLDMGNTLDQGDFLDSDTFQVPSKHIAFEIFPQTLITSNGKEYINPYLYLDFMNKESSYNKKCVEAVHNGVQLNLICAGYAPYFDELSSSTYSIDNLKANCSITNLYNPSDSIINTFYYLEAGIGVKNLYPNSVNTTFSNLVGWWSFDENVGNRTCGCSGNTNIGTLYGSYSKVDNFLGKALVCNGTNVYVNVPNFGIDMSLGKAFCFWIKKDTTGVGPEYIISFSGGQGPQIYYDDTIQQLTYINKNLTIETNVVFDLADGNYHYVVVNRDASNNVEIFIDKNSIGTGTATGAFGALVYSFDIGRRYNNIDFLSADIDEVRIYDRILTTTEINYIYDNEISSLNQLKNIVYKEKISSNEIIDVFGENWIISLFNIPYNTIKNYLIAYGDGSTESITDTAPVINIKENSFYVTFTSNNIERTIYDNGYGILIDTYNTPVDKFSGTINYITGEYTINFFEDYSITENFTFAPAQNNHIGITTDNPLILNTFTVTATDGATVYTATSNSLGVISTTAISGTVDAAGNYNISFTFSAISCSLTYSYKEIELPDTDTEIKIGYISYNNLEITEMGIRNLNNQLIGYATFPPMEVNTNENHLGCNFIIKKS